MDIWLYEDYGDKLIRIKNDVPIKQSDDAAAVIPSEGVCIWVLRGMRTGIETHVHMKPEPS